MVSKSIANQEAHQRLMKRLEKKKCTTTSDEIPTAPPTADTVISKPGKDSEIARAWMLENEHDPLFNVSIHSLSIIQRESLITL